MDLITKENVNKLGLAWSLDLGFKRGFGATSIVVDVIMYISRTWSKVYAIDARTGQLIWTYDPKGPGRFGIKAFLLCGKPGVALCKGKADAGTLDESLIALNAADGNTFPVTNQYGINGAGLNLSI